MKWSENQLKAIELKDQPILVCASAGAGKTAVLTQRIIKRCLTDGVDMNRIVALTFTQAAANEMKQRVLAALMDKLNDPSYDQALIKRQLALLEEAQISTIHSFCLNILKKYAYIIGFDTSRIDNKFTGSSLNLLKEEAFNLMLDQLDTDDLYTLQTYFSTKAYDYSAMSKTLADLLDQAIAENDPYQWIDSIATHYQTKRSIHDFDKSLLPYFYQTILDQLEQIEYYSKSILAFANDKYIAKNEDKIKQVLESVVQTRTTITNNDLDSLLECIRYGFTTVLSKSKGNSIYEYDYPNKINSLCLDLINTYDSTILINDNNALTDVSLALSKALRLYLDSYNQLKTKYNGIDFNDMELLAYQILSNNPDIALQYQQLYQEILVDEFQDTSVRQNDIINLVSNKINIFRVGDVKQSIYRFRQASPALMRSLMEDPQQTVIVLDENYRSSASIIDATNKIFSNVMNIDPRLDKYGDIDIVKPGTQAQRDSYLSIDFYDLQEDALEESNPVNSSNTKKAQYITYLIQQQKNTTQFKSYKDYCVLVRSRSAMNALKIEFDKANIPYAMDLKSGFSNSNALQLVKAFLTLALNPNHELSYMVILTSHIYHLSVTDLYDLTHPYPLIPSIKANYKELYDFIQALHNNAYLGLYQLLHMIYIFNNCYQSCSKEDRFNYDYLLDYLSSNSQCISINDALNQLNEVIDTDSSEINVISSEDDVVKVMTIHQSKGLQFPVVILWSDSQARNNEAKEVFNLHPDLHLGLKALHLPYRAVHPSLNYSLIKYDNGLQDLSERLRLLYVALTRPKEKLIMVDCVKQRSEYHQFTLTDLLARRGFSDPILSALEVSQLFHYIQVNQSFAIPVNPKDNTSKQTTILSYPFINKQSLTSSSASSLMAQEHEIKIMNQQALAYGTLLHEMIETLDIDELSYDNLTHSNSSLSSSQINALVTFSTKLKEFIKHHNIDSIEKEYPFITKSNDSIISGSIDMLGSSNDTYYIIDYKTNHMDHDELINTYRSQLELYSSIIHKYDSSKSIECYLYSFYNKEFIKVE